MDTLTRSRHLPLHSLQWRKEFSTRQTAIYRCQDSRLRVPIGGSVIDEFFCVFKPGLTPPRRHELLRLFLEQTGALHSFPDIIRDQHPPANKRVLAVVDDRCDPCLQFTSIAESRAFLPVRQWGSEEYMRRPPEGLHTQICALDAEMLYTHLNQDVSYSPFGLWSSADLPREQAVQSAESCKFSVSSVNSG